MKCIQSFAKLYSIESKYVFNTVLIFIQFNVEIYIQFNVEKCIQSDVEIYSIAGQNIFNPMIDIFYLHGNKLTKTRGFQK